MGECGMIRPREREKKVKERLEGGGGLRKYMGFAISGSRELGDGQRECICSTKGGTTHDE